MGTMSGSIQRIAEALGRSTRVCFRVTFADGSSWQNLPAEPVVHFRFKTAWPPSGAPSLFGHIGLLESYFDQSLDVDGDLARAFRIAFEAGFDHDAGPLVWLRNHWHELRFGNRSIAQAKANARFHYGLGADFYRLWLDEPLMMYTCGYWKRGHAHARGGAAQQDRPRLPQDPARGRARAFVDIGCGFGGFMFRALGALRRAR